MILKDNVEFGRNRVQPSHFDNVSADVMPGVAVLLAACIVERGAGDRTAIGQGQLLRNCFFCYTSPMSFVLGCKSALADHQYKKSFDRIFHDLTLPDEPSIYINAANRTDAAVAPAEGDAITALVPTGHINIAHPQDWDALRQRARQTVLDQLERLGLSDVRHNITAEATLGPAEYENDLNLAKGAAFGLSHNFVSEDDIAAGRVTERWQALIAFQITRARQFYTQAWPGVGLLHKDGRFGIASASSLYEAILDDILAHRCNVFTRRAHVSAWGKALRLPSIWWRSQRLPDTT